MDSKYELTYRVRRLFKLLAEASSTHLSPWDVTVQERALLEHLFREGPAAVPTIARTFFVSRQNIQVRANSLLSKKLLEKRVNPTHTRSTLLALSKAGERVFTEIAEAEKSLIITIFEGVSSEQIDTSNQTLQTLMDTLSGLKEKPA